MAKEKLRSVNTHFWDDPYIVGLDPSEKLLFLYLLTNPLCNLLGVYEISIRRISFDTGFEKDMVEKMLDRFVRDKKIVCYEGYIALLNFMKNQRYNSNMLIGAKEIFKTLPNGLQTLLNGLQTLWKEEVEEEVESEEEVEKEIGISFENFWNAYDKKIGSKPKLEKKWNKLTDSEREAIMIYIPKYIQSQPDKKYRKNPETFLNNKSWNDEIISKRRNTIQEFEPIKTY